MDTMQVQMTNGERIEVRRVKMGDAYGRSAINTSGKELVEFRLGWGCFQYWVETILEGDQDRGLVLHGGYRDNTTVGGKEMKAVREWLRSLEQEAPVEGVTRCECGSKYWDGMLCHSCREEWKGLYERLGKADND